MKNKVFFESNPLLEESAIYRRFINYAVDKSIKAACPSYNAYWPTAHNRDKSKDGLNIEKAGEL